jgi:hypothetical protein
MAAKPRDPFQTEFSTVEELLGNPSGGLLVNPSKAYETILAAVKADADSWIGKRGINYYYVILSGPMTGTYILGPRSKKYMGELIDTIYYENPQMLGLARLRYEAVMKRIRPLLDAILAAEKKTGHEAFWGETNLGPIKWKRAEAELNMSEEEFYDRNFALGDYSPDHEKMIMESWHRRVRAYKADPVEYEDKYLELHDILAKKNHPAFGLAETAYILSQAAGVPVEKVIADLEEQPKRYLGLERLRLPGRLTDRKKFAKAFLKRWSTQDAFNAVLSGVEGGIPHTIQYLPDPDKIRRAMSGVPSWKQTVLADVATRQRAFEGVDFAEVFAGEDPPRRRASKSAGVSKAEMTSQAIRDYVIGAVGLQTRLAQSGMTPKEFRQMLPKRGQPYLRRLADAAEGIREGMGVLVENNEGRILVRALNQKDWPAVYRGHDMAVAAAEAARQADESEAGLARAEAHKSLARQFTLPPGVRPLVTKEEYRIEGNEMRHCVFSMGYYGKMSSFEFAFQAPDGSRATLELGIDGTVRQFFGPNDSNPGPALRQMLAEFQTANSANIKAMARGEFPVKPAKENPLERADADTAAVGLFDRDSEDFQIILFDLADYAKYKKTGSENMLNRSIIGFLHIGPWRPTWKLGETFSNERPPGAMKVSSAVSVQGYGPLLYATAMKMLEKRKRNRLYPDNSLSAHAKVFWSRFPKGYMEPLDTDKFTSTFGVSPAAITRRGQSMTVDEVQTIVDAGDNLFYDIYNDMDVDTGKMRKILPRQKYLNTLAKKAAAEPMRAAANPFDHFPRRSR